LVALRDDDQTMRWLLDGERRYPTHPRVQQELALLEVLTGRPAEAVSRARRAVEQGPPDNPEGVMALAEIAYLAETADLDALTQPVMKDSAGNSVWLGETARVRYAYAIGRRGDTRRMSTLLAEAEGIARRRVDEGDENPLRRVELGAIAALGKREDSALDWLSRAYDSGYREYGLLERDPAFAVVRGTPRFRALLDGMRRDVAAQRQAAREKGLLDFDSLLHAGRRDASRQ
jgi:hypothetical protein